MSYHHLYHTYGLNLNRRRPWEAWWGQCRFGRQLVCYSLDGRKRRPDRCQSLALDLNTFYSRRSPALCSSRALPIVHGPCVAATNYTYFSLSLVSLNSMRESKTHWTPGRESNDFLNKYFLGKCTCDSDNGIRLQNPISRSSPTGNITLLLLLLNSMRDCKTHCHPGRDGNDLFAKKQQ